MLPGESLEMTLARIERNLVFQVWKRTGGNTARAARQLDMPRETLRYKIRKFGFSLDLA